MTQSELKELKAIGAELGAAKAEVERLREALRWYEEKVAECRKIGSLGDNARQALDLDGGFRARDALSQQAEPVCDWPTCECALDLDKCKVQSVEPAPAQDEPIFGDEDHVSIPRGLIGAACSAIDKKRDALKVLAELRRYTFGDLSRPAQTEQQPVAVPEDFQPLETIRWWISAYTNPENGPSYQGHGMMVQMLCEYEALRIMLSSRAQQRPTAYPHEAMDKLAADRYRVGAAGAGTLHGFAVRAGDGEQELYRGSKSDCEHVARKLAGAFLDGGFTAFERYAAPIAQTEQSGYLPLSLTELLQRYRRDLELRTFPDNDEGDYQLRWTAKEIERVNAALSAQAPKP